MIVIFSIIFSIVSIIISYQFEKDSEPLFLLKLSGYYTLSVITISINYSIPIPIGFLAAFILTAAADSNACAKRLCIMLGFADFLICAILFYI